jgi:hypothetical protein
MTPAARSLSEGLLVLILSLAMWRLTQNGLAWAAFFVPGSALVVRGLWLVLTDDR